MKWVYIALIGAVSLITGSPVAADVLGESDGQYLGLQLTFHLDRKRQHLFDRAPELNAMLIQQVDGSKEGIVYTRSDDGIETVGFISPTASFKIGEHPVSDFTVPVVNVSDTMETQGGSQVAAAVLGVIVLGALVIEVSNDVEDAADEAIDCLDPATDAQTLENC